MAFQPVPTYQDPVIVDERTGKSAFNPTWLSWFLTLTNGGLSTTVQHNQLNGLQGGASNQFYHLTAAQYSNVYIRHNGAPTAITVGASPFVYQNPNSYDLDVLISGTPSITEFSRDGATYYASGTASGMFRLSPGDFLRVTWVGSATMTGIPR